MTTPPESPGSLDDRPTDFAAPGTPFVTAISGYADREPDAVAIVDGTHSVTRGELEARTNRLARSFAQRGVVEGSFVTIALPNEIAFLEAVIATWKLGAIPQPVSFRLPPRELLAIVDVVRPALVVGLDAGDAAESMPAGLEFAPDADDGPLPVVVSSSWKAPTSGGSSGTPKVIVSTQPAVVDVLLPLLPLLKFSRGGVKLIPTPLGHNAAIMWATGALITGATIVLMPKFESQRTLDLIEEYHVDWTCLVPTMLHRIAQLPAEARDRADLSSIEAIATGASMCPQWLKEFWVDWLGPDRMVEFYASTESQAIVIANGNGWLDRPGSVGQVMVGEIEVRDPAGRVLPEGEVGELWMRRGAGQPTPYEYRGATAQGDDDGFETVGDLGALRSGWLYLADRKADMVVVAASNVYPAEIEGALDEHPLVASSCVVGIPDDEFGSRLYAFVQTSGDVTDDELIAHLRERLVAYKVPRIFERVAEPLRDDAGKVRRSLLRERAIAARSVSPST